MSAKHLFLGMFIAAAIILGLEIRNANTGIEHDTFCRWVEMHQKHLEVERDE